MGRLAISLGDPGGIGPEIVFKAIRDVRAERGFQPVLFGPKAVLGEALISSLAEGLDYEFVDVGGDFELGEVSAANGSAALAALDAAAQQVIIGQADALVTAPISKKAIRMAGSEFSGHTTFLKDKAGADSVSMGFYSPQLKVVLATIHVPYSHVPALLNHKTLELCLANTLLFAKSLGIHYPKIALAGLNPHAGENGLFGNEERDLLAPFVDGVDSDGFSLTGPYPADVVFRRAVDGEFDFVIALSHDQGLIPVKLLGFHEAVNVTLGLPFIRTSPDYGTAFDIAGQGIAESGSMAAAISLALNMNRATGWGSERSSG